MKTLYNLIALIAIANFLIIGGLVGYLIVSGKLNSESAGIMAAALRGEKMIPATTSAPAASQPATQPAVAKAPVSLDSVEMQLAYIEHEKKEIEDRFARLKDAEFKLIQDREALTQKQQEFDRQVRIQEKSIEDAGFNKTLEMYTQMPPKQTKEIFMKLDPEIVVRFLMNMKKQAYTKVIKEFKTQAEQQRLQELLERIRTQQVLLDQRQPTDKAKG